MNSKQRAKAITLVFCILGGAPGIAVAEEHVAGCDIDEARTTATILEGELQEPTARLEMAATALVKCLSDHDSSVRDAVAYGRLRLFFRSANAPAEVKDAVSAQLVDLLIDRGDDNMGQSFAALVLSEAVRADRNSPFLSTGQRAAIADAGISFLRELQDHRGFEPDVGWRHGAAHGADLLVQVALNPNFERALLWTRMRDALAVQVAPVEHYYVHGEPERLARLAMAIAMRSSFSSEDWRVWFCQLSEPPPGQDWASALGTPQGLARKHNVGAFLQAVWLSAHFSETTEDDILLSGAEAALRAMP